MRNKTKLLILALLGTVISAVIVVWGAHVMFQGVRVNNHLQAGSFKVGLYRTAYSQYAPDGQGELKELENEEKIDLTKDDTPIFSVTGAVPSCWYQADLKVCNEGGRAFSHGVRILWSAEEATEEEKSFASQMEIVVTYAGAQKKFFLSDCEKQENQVDLGVLEPSETQDFSVKATFLEGAENNVVQASQIIFDVQVFATQYIQK